VAGFLMPAAGIGTKLAPFARAALGGNFWNFGCDTLDDLDRIDKAQRKSSPR